MNSLYPLIRKISQLNIEIGKTDNLESQKRYREAIVDLEVRISNIRKCRNDPRNLEALFFPYSRILDEVSLKKAALVFDKIWFLDSLDKISREVTLTYSDYLPIQQLRDNWDSIKSSYDLLEEHSMVSYYDTTLINRDFSKQIADHLIQDVEDSQVNILVPPNKRIWALQKSEFPIKHIIPSIPLCLGKYSEYPTVNYFGADVRFDPTGKLDLLEEANYVFVDELHGKSIKLSQAIQVSLFEDLSLFTNDFSSLNLMTHRIERITKKAVEVKTSEAISLDRAHIAFTILDNILSDELLQKRSMKEILRYRDECGDLRVRFLDSISSMYELLSNKDNFDKELKLVITNKLIPEIRKTQFEYKSIYEKMFGDIVKLSAKTTSAGLAGGGLVATVFSVSMINTLLVTSGVAALAILPIVIDAYLSRRNLSRSPWVFILPYTKGL